MTCSLVDGSSCVFAGKEAASSARVILPRREAFLSGRRLATLLKQRKCDKTYFYVRR
jgi:hypothetical protein